MAIRTRQQGSTPHPSGAGLAVPLLPFTGVGTAGIVRARRGMKRGRLKWPSKRGVIRAALIASIVFCVGDIVYRIVCDISYVNREQCVLYRILPEPGFLAFESFFETLVIVFVGTFVAVLLSRAFLRFRRFLPGNPVTAFVLGSLLPVCSCAVIPLLISMKGKLKFSTTMSFVLSAPLLSPYIIVLSFSVLGFRYGVLRILSSFVLVMASAFILSLFRKEDTYPRVKFGDFQCRGACEDRHPDVYFQTFDTFKSLLPFLLIAGVLTITLEHFGARTLLLRQGLSEGPAGIMLWILVGVPLYFCNGAEVLFLRPLMSHGFPTGTGMAFSMTSTAICTTSIAMLLRTLGARLTFVLATSVVLISLTLALVLNRIV